MNNLPVSLFLFAFLCFCTSSAQQQFLLTSPNNKLKVEVTIDDSVSYSISHEQDRVLEKSTIAMTLSNGSILGAKPVLTKTTTQTVHRAIESPFYKKKQITEYYNEVAFRFKKGYQIIFRAYDDGIAYRFVSEFSKPFMVLDERAEFVFPENHKAYVAYANRPEGSFETQYMNSFENIYQHIPLSEWNTKRLGIMPLLIECVNNKKICITEADLMNYPGMFLYPGEQANTLKGIFAPYPKEVRQGGHNNLQELVLSRESFIAKYEKGTLFPWRVIVVSENDKELADNDMVYKLATPAANRDYSWVKPGKIAWDWWNAWNLYEVDFRAGINTDTYKYYIDFASEYGIEYVILDEGWAVTGEADLFKVVPEIDLQELVEYGKRKNVGLILWAGNYAFNRDMEQICKHYSNMGIKGFKIDFMDRDDQVMVDFHRRAAETAMRHYLLVDFHGTYKPTGLHRTYPNVLNYEGVFGLEQMKWDSSVDQVTYDVIVPFIRMIAGPMDYTQGAMRNANKGNYRSVFTEAMSQGTRCRQLAEYVIFESPMNMLCDSPSNYLKEKECTEFIAEIPTVWDQTIVLGGEVGEYLAIARKKEEFWYVGAITNWNARTLELDFSFLEEGAYNGEVFKDGINADRAARDYKKEIVEIPANRKLSIKMAPGGGFAMKISRRP